MLFKDGNTRLNIKYLCMNCMYASLLISHINYKVIQLVFFFCLAAFQFLFWVPCWVKQYTWRKKVYYAL